MKPEKHDCSRRDFLKHSLLGAVALGIASFPGEPLTGAIRNIEGRRKKTARRVVLLSLDGICVEGFRKARTPHLDNLLAQGVLSLKTRVVMPSVTLPNWTSHLTGSGPELHGVVDNSWTIDKFKLPAIETDSDGYYPSVFKVLKDKKEGIKTAFYYNWPNLIYPYNQKYLDDICFWKTMPMLLIMRGLSRSLRHTGTNRPWFSSIRFTLTMPAITTSGCLRNTSGLSKKPMKKSAACLIN